MATKNVTSCIHGSTTITGVTRFTCSLRRSVAPVHYDDESYAQGAAMDGWVCEGSIEGVDFDQLAAVEGNSIATLTVICGAADDGGTAKTFVILDALPYGFQFNAGDPGTPATGTISYTAVSADGSTSPLAIT